jgi:GT2 family glycosyltransferase
VQTTSQEHAVTAPISRADEAFVPLVSVIILNYNGNRWLERCLESLKVQTIFSQLEVIIADNQSTDGSDQLAVRLLEGWNNGRFIQNGGNLGFCEGNNRPAAQARGQFLFFLNNDTWLEPSCLETLVHEVRAQGAQGGGPLVLNYADDSFQSLGADGYDIFGLPSPRRSWMDVRPVLMPEGCAFLIERRVFVEVGGFNADFFMYADEYDLGFRTWIAGYRLVAVPGARLHHRGAANVNPKGAGVVEEFRTSAQVRFFSNRNCLLLWLQNARHLLFVVVCLQVTMLFLESLVALVLIRDAAFVKKAYFGAYADCWRLRRNIMATRKRVARYRQRGDGWMLRFLGWRLSRWQQFQMMRAMGIPKVNARIKK